MAHLLFSISPCKSIFTCPICEMLCVLKVTLKVIEGTNTNRALKAEHYLTLKNNGRVQHL